MITIEICICMTKCRAGFATAVIPVIHTSLVVFLSIIGRFYTRDALCVQTHNASSMLFIQYKDGTNNPTNYQAISNL